MTVNRAEYQVIVLYFGALYYIIDDKCRKFWLICENLVKDQFKIILEK